MTLVNFLPVPEPYAEYAVEAYVAIDDWDPDWQGFPTVWIVVPQAIFDEFTTRYEFNGWTYEFIDTPIRSSLRWGSLARSESSRAGAMIGELAGEDFVDSEAREFYSMLWRRLQNANAASRRRWDVFLEEYVVEPPPPFSEERRPIRSPNPAGQE